MANQEPTTPDKCDHGGGEPADCVKCNPIFKGVKVPPRKKGTK